MGERTRALKIEKIDSTPQAVVVSTGIVTVAALVAFLVWTGKDIETILALAVTAAGLFTGQYATTRKASQLDAKQDQLDAKQDQQTGKLDTVVRQTNGELKATVSDAVETGIARAVAAYRHDQEVNRG